MADVSRMPLYRTIWRWHFYAGLFVIPFILILSLTGAAYLFKPQIDRWEERDWRGLAAAQPVDADAQVAAALAAFPGAAFHSYRIPEAPGEAAVIHLGLPGGTMRDVAVSPQGRVIGSADPDQRWTAWLARLHGKLLLGLGGGILVELAASWAIVMILTGLYLWWPRGRGLAGVVWPRLRLGGRAALRDLHAVTGFWVSGLALVLLTTALPWTDIWATGFRAVRAEMGWVSGAQDWKGGARSARRARPWRDGQGDERGDAGASDGERGLCAAGQARSDRAARADRTYARAGDHPAAGGAQYVRAAQRQCLDADDADAEPPARAQGQL